MASMKLLVTGAGGQVGFELAAALKPLGHVLAVDRTGLDLSDHRAIATLVRDFRPDVLVNAAAYTAVDQAESERDLAYAINATAPGIMAECMARVGGLLVHYSTDYVYDGQKTGPYVESDPVAPLNEYGASKLAGEAAIARTGVDHVILRTSWVYGLRGRNFLNTICRLAGQKPELRIVADQFGAPTWAAWIARETARIVGACHPMKAGSAAGPSDLSGIYHLTAGGETTWHGFASRIVATLAQRGVVPSIPVLPISAAEYPLPARRPMNSVLDNSKARRAFGVEQVSWEAQLDECLAARA